MTKLSLPGKLLGGCFVAAACLVTAAGTALSGAPPQAPKKVQIKIIVDGKEIDLSDHIGGLIEAQTKPAANPNVAVVGGNVDREVVYSIVANERVQAQAKPQGEVRYVPLVGSARIEGGEVVLAQVGAPPDPRVEELVKQAEAIKPGSGAAIRRALLGEAKTVDPTVRTTTGARFVPAAKDATVRVWEVDKTTTKAATPQVHVIESTGGQKIIILTIQDGKVQQLNEADLKKLLEKKGVRVEAAPRKTQAQPNVRELPPTPLAPKPPLPKATETTKPAPMAPTPLPQTGARDLDALRRELERLTAELQDLRKRLDTKK